MKGKYLTIAGFIVTLLFLGAISLVSYPEIYIRKNFRDRLFKIQSIDTMKYSRDLARAKARDPGFDKVIDAQMKLITEAGATHVAIGTPYDEEFISFLKRWVASARAHGLSVWFRGNFSGWEGWFSYPKITRAEHRRLLNVFIKKHPDLFESGDVFTPCPECENGGLGDPRNTGDKAGYRKFLIDEFGDAKSVFGEIGKNVELYASMNGDIARYVMDSASAESLGGGILIDHYVASADAFGKDIADIREKLGVNIGIGEFGAPIPDLNGNMTEAAQAKFVEALFRALYLQSENIPLVNYWVFEGGTTALVRGDKPREAYSVIKDYYRMPSLSGTIFDTDGKYLSGAQIGFADGSYSVKTDTVFYQIFIPPAQRKLIVSKDGYDTFNIELPADFATSTVMDIYLESTTPKPWYSF
ncbi:hypothetical protein A3B97_03960 [Candidatus Giovannonibacteria bacterium RIFCSPHIGHO2_02_FULL_43_32]|nr:MAG: hypothetical protein A3B97_03960 [Candidatus Giovannonibacteria bacterium RIFCSPHIGHO2_02_FULL_43_32]